MHPYFRDPRRVTILKLQSLVDATPGTCSCGLTARLQYDTHQSLSRLLGYSSCNRPEPSLLPMGRPQRLALSRFHSESLLCRTRGHLVMNMEGRQQSLSPLVVSPELKRSNQLALRGGPTPQGLIAHTFISLVAYCSNMTSCQTRAAKHLPVRFKHQAEINLHVTIVGLGFLRFHRHRGFRLQVSPPSQVGRFTSLRQYLYYLQRYVRSVIRTSRLTAFLTSLGFPVFMKARDRCLRHKFFRLRVIDS